MQIYVPIYYIILYFILLILFLAMLSSLCCKTTRQSLSTSSPYAQYLSFPQLFPGGGGAASCAGGPPECSFTATASTFSSCGLRCLALCRYGEKTARWWMYALLLKLVLVGSKLLVLVVKERHLECWIPSVGFGTTPLKETWRVASPGSWIQYLSAWFEHRRFQACKCL